MIDIQNLRVDFDRVTALDSVQMRAGTGEVLGLVGPNGAGKTTLFKAILGLIEPSAGSVLVGGIDVALHPDDARRVIGFMPDFSPLYEQLTVNEFMELFAKSYCIPSAQRAPAINEKLELVGLTEKRQAFLKGLSRGMRQRLMLAKTLLPEPAVLLLDEPASGLDPQGRILLKDIILGLKSTKRTIVISSHILSEMSEFCTGIAVLEKGRVVVQGRIDEVAAAMLGQARIELRYLNMSDGARDVLRNAEGCKVLADLDKNMSIELAGGDEGAARLLSTLIAAGAVISSFARTTAGIEDIYRKIAPKELS